MAITDPTDITNCELWLAADNIAGLSDGDPVSTWNDESGNGNDATQTGGMRPTYKTGIVPTSGKPVVRFDATDDGMTTGLVLDLPLTVFVVYAGNHSTSNRRAVQGTGTNWLIGPFANKHQFYNGSFINGGTITAGVFVRAHVTQATGDAKFYLDGSLIGSNANNTDPGTDFALGYSGSFGNPLDGDIAEVICYSKVLSGTEQSDVLDYLDTKYNTAGGGGGGPTLPTALLGAGVGCGAYIIG